MLCGRPHIRRALGSHCRATSMPGRSTARIWCACTSSASCARRQPELVARTRSWRCGCRRDGYAMLLEHKVAIIYGAGGPVGWAVARAFAREGARVFLAGRTVATLDTVAGEIHSQGGFADTGVVDALDEQAVDEYV